MLGNMHGHNSLVDSVAAVVLKLTGCDDNQSLRTDVTLALGGFSARWRAVTLYTTFHVFWNCNSPKEKFEITLYS